jgi:hypothetical protein
VRDEDLYQLTKLVLLIFQTLDKGVFKGPPHSLLSSQTSFLNRFVTGLLLFHRKQLYVIGKWHICINDT